jgi:hypothetical protein
VRVCVLEITAASERAWARQSHGARVRRTTDVDSASAGPRDKDECGATLKRLSPRATVTSETPSSVRGTGFFGPPEDYLLGLLYEQQFHLSFEKLGSGYGSYRSAIFWRVFASACQQKKQGVKEESRKGSMQQSIAAVQLKSNGVEQQQRSNSAEQRRSKTADLQSSTAVRAVQHEQRGKAVEQQSNRATEQHSSTAAT